MSHAVEEGHTFKAFAADVKRAWSAWGVAPWLPVITAGLAVALGLPGVLQTLIVGEPCLPSRCTSEAIRSQIRLSLTVSLLFIPVSLFHAGWSGTERIWYLRIFRGRSLSRQEGWSFSWSFLGRFFVLGLIIALVLVPVYLLTFWSLLVRVRSQPGPPDLDSLRFWQLAVSTVAVLIVEFVLTFVTPALAYTTRRVTEALRIGIRMIKDTWPKCALYVLVPPFAVTLIARFLPAQVVEVWWRLALLPGSALLNLLFKGATAAFYLRRFEVGDRGAVGKAPSTNPN